MWRLNFSTELENCTIASREDFPVFHIQASRRYYDYNKHVLHFKEKIYWTYFRNERCPPLWSLCGVNRKVDIRNLLLNLSGIVLLLLWIGMSHIGNCYKKKKREIFKRTRNKDPRLQFCVGMRFCNLWCIIERKRFRFAYLKFTTFCFSSRSIRLCIQISL